MRRQKGQLRPTRGRCEGGVILSAAILACLGCDSSEVGYAAKSSAVASAAAAPAAEAAPARADGPKGKAELSPAADRKIIYNAQVTLIVDSLGGFDAKFTKLVKESGGYVSQTDQSSQADAQRTGSWTIRVPVERFDGFLAAIGRLGELQRSHLDSQDVTMEYYDLEARIANKQKEETRLQKHLSDSTGKLEDILAVERELTRVRGEVEQMQGRIRYLGNLAALSTVTLTVTEIRNYVPPVRPTFVEQVARAFHESLESLVGFGKLVVLFAAAIAPWLPLLLVGALVLRWAFRRVLRIRPPVVLNRNGP